MPDSVHDHIGTPSAGGRLHGAPRIVLGEVHMGVVWIKALTIRTGHANVIAHVDAVLSMMSAGILDPTPLVSRHMKLDEAPEAYEAYANREALKIVMAP